MVKEGEGTPPPIRRGITARAVAGTVLAVAAMVRHQQLARTLHQCRQVAMERQMVEAMVVNRMEVSSIWLWEALFAFEFAWHEGSVNS